MKFNFSAQIVFEADNVSEAAIMLAKHFTDLALEFEGYDIPKMPAWFTGIMELKPADKEPQQ